MTEKQTNPIRETDDAARGLARALLSDARFGALGVIEPATGSPMVTRIAVGITPDGAPLTLVSSLSQHTAALRREPACSLLVGEPGATGDPLTHPRLTLQCRARFVERSEPGHAVLRDFWLAHHPKSKLYLDFADFGFVVLEPRRGFLNGGFGKAYLLTAADLAPPPPA